MDPPIILIHIPKNVQQKTANMSDMSQELERELEKAAEESARGIVKRCLDAASTDSDKVGWCGLFFERAYAEKTGLVNQQFANLRLWPSRNSGFIHWKWWFSIVMLVYQRVVKKIMGMIRFCEHRGRNDVNVIVFCSYIHVHIVYGILCMF